VVGLAITALVIAGGFAVLIAGLRVSYHQRADKCAALDISPVAQIFGQTPLEGYPDTDHFDCMAAVGDDPMVPTAIVGLSVVYHDSAFEARLDYEDSSEADKPGRVELPGGKRGRLFAAPLGGGGCAIQAALQDVNVTMTAQLTFGDRTRCHARGPAADALADTMRRSLARLA
jgi:hypothetical protein